MTEVADRQSVVLILDGFGLVWQHTVLVETVMWLMLREDQLVAVDQVHFYLVGGDGTWHLRCEIDLNRVDLGLNEEFQLVGVDQTRLCDGLLHQHLIDEVIRFLDHCISLFHLACNTARL